VKESSAVRRSFRRILGCLLLVAAPCATAAEMNLYDWVGVAPVVIQADVVEKDGKYVRLVASRVFRGDIEEGKDILLNLRKVNRYVDLDNPPLKLPPGTSYFMLLQPAPPRGKKQAEPAYDLVRGPKGVRRLSAEGAGAVVAALESLIEIQDRKNENETWKGMRRLLDESNPVLLMTSLEHHIKFARGEPDLIPTVRVLLDHPRADVRETAAQLIQRIVRRYGRDSVPEESALHNDLATHARGDPVVAVRVAATEALDGLWGPQTEELMREIASGDPDQLVRFTAQRLLYERRTAAESEGGTR
jgi:hypothetical protein